MIFMFCLNSSYAILHTIINQVLHNLVKRGRKAKITAEIFINVVKKKRTLSDSVLCEVLGINRSTIYRFKMNNPIIIKEMDDFIKQYENVVFNGKVSIDVFYNISEIKDWIEILKQRQVSSREIQTSVRSLYNVCNALQVPPKNLNVELVSNFSE